MLVFRDVDLALADGATPLSVVRHVRGVLGDDVARRIWLEARGRSAASLERRVLEVVPAMSTTAIEPEMIERLAAGVPHDFALTYANVYWGPVPALLRTAATFGPARAVGEPLSDVQGAEVRVYCVASRTPIVLELAAGVIDDAPPPEATALPTLPALIAALGKPKPRGLRVIASPDERAAMNAIDAERGPIERALIDRLRAALTTEIYPHAIASDPSGRAGLGSIKAAFGPPLAALGYRSAARGTSKEQWFVRRTPRDNELAIYVHRGARYGGVHVSMSISGPLWFASMAVPLAPGVDHVNVWSGDTLRRIADNVAFAARFIEGELIAEVEPAHPRGSAWFARDAS